MKLAVAGATGRIGGGLTREALAQGHQVVALVRTPENLNIQHESLTVSSISLFCSYIFRCYQVESYNLDLLYPWSSYLFPLKNLIIIFRDIFGGGL